MYVYSVKLMYWQLLLYGVHVGHSFKNSVIFSAWFVYTFRQNILIINLFKTMLMLKNGYVGLNGACHLGGPIWFINLDRSVELFINYSAKQCGEFCYATYWIYGLISNWLTLANTFKKLGRMAKAANKGQFAKLEMDSSPWVMGRFSWPRATFISSVSTSPHPAKESLYLGIPCLGFVDTNVSGHIANIAIPGNDDSLECLVFYNTHISQYILEKKYGNISGWFFHTRRHKRVIGFLDWVFYNYMSNDGFVGKTGIEVLAEEQKDHEIPDEVKINLKYKVPYNTIWTYGLDFFFSRNHGLTNFKEQVDLYEQDNNANLNVDMGKLLLKHRQSSVYLSKIINYYVLKASWRYGRFLKRYLLKREWFKRRFLVGFYEKFVPWDVTDSKNYMKARFYVNKVYKTHLRKNKWRFNKFMLKFLKFYLATKFSKVRGFFKPMNSNFLNVTSLAYVANSIGSRFFMEAVYPCLVKDNKRIGRFREFGKKNVFVKWHFFRKAMIQKLVLALNDKRISRIRKLSIKWKASQILAKSFYQRVKFFYMHYVAFFNFYMWNRVALLSNKKESAKYCYKEWKILKKMQRNYIYIDFLRKSESSYNIFKRHWNGECLRNVGLIYYFKSLTQNYRKAFFRNIESQKIEKLLRVPQHFKKVWRHNDRKRKWIMRKATEKKYYRVSPRDENKPYKKKLRGTVVKSYPVLKPQRELIKYYGDARFKYKRNRYISGAEQKFARFGRFLGRVSEGTYGMRKAKYYYSKILSRIDLQFIDAPLSLLGLARSEGKAYPRRLANKQNSFKWYVEYITNHTISVFSLTGLNYRYFYPYFYRWGELNTKDAEKKLELNAFNAKLTEKEGVLIKKNLNYISQRAQMQNVCKLHKISLKGVSNYLLIGDKEQPTLFIHRHWAYSKGIFGYPPFFCLARKGKFGWESKQIEAPNNKLKKGKAFFYLFFFAKLMLIFQRHLGSKFAQNLIKPKLWLKKYDAANKRLYWG